MGVLMVPPSCGCYDDIVKYMWQQMIMSQPHNPPAYLCSLVAAQEGSLEAASFLL